ncbi:hypothetical protein AB0G49_03645 [Streptomyces longwoodensis]|uniref:hypothetical protein n=1 Tax=Streptomyces longwoodensis TaxID=68231 RepID=UPI0033F27F56
MVVAWHLVLVPWHHAVPDAVWYGPYTASQWLSAPLYAALICAAALAYVGVERPAERRLRGTTRRAGTRTGPRPPSGTAPSAGPAPSARPAVGAGFEGRAQGDQD